MSRNKLQKPKKFITEEILRMLLAGVAIYITAGSSAGARRVIKGFRQEWNRNTARRAMERLQRKKLIEYCEKPDGTIVAVITYAGKRKVKELDIDTLEVQKPSIWDKRWRIVTFDIAEKRKKGREALREFLKRTGFHQLQKSMYVHPYSCRAEIELVQEIFSLPKREVLYFSTDRVPDESALKKKFGLK
jgi:DNA-binding transcriptional regulator PaaX